MPKTPAPPVVYTVAEVAELLKCSEGTVLTAIHDRRLIAISIGSRKCYRVLAEDLERFQKASRLSRPIASTESRGISDQHALAIANEIEPETAGKRTARFNRRRLS